MNINKMKNLPQNIFLQVVGDEEVEDNDDFNAMDSSTMTWSANKVFKSDFQYTEVSEVKRLLRRAFTAGDDYDSFGGFVEMNCNFEPSQKKEENTIAVAPDSLPTLYKLKSLRWSDGDYMSFARMPRHSYTIEDHEGAFHCGWNDSDIGQKDTLEETKVFCEKHYHDQLAQHLQPFVLFGGTANK